MNMRNARMRPALLAVMMCALAAGCRPSSEEAPVPDEERLAGGVVHALQQEPGRDPGTQAPAGDAVQEERPGLEIDLEARRVTVAARTTEVWDLDPVEFILIPTSSGKDYEALAQTPVKPGEVHRALLAIGLAPGRPVDYQKARFWPRGERVRILLEWEDGEGTLRRERVGALLQDRRTGAPLPDEGFLFTGSRMIPMEEGAEPVYAADHMEPMSIIPTYNDPETVVDLPFQAGQADQYGHIIRAPETGPPRETDVRIVFEPWQGPNAKPGIDVHLDVGQAQDPEEGRPVIQVVVREGDGDPRTMGTAELVKRFGELAQAGRWPYVHVRFDDGLTAPLAAAFCQVLRAVESPRGIRVDGRQEGHLYYRAFVAHPVLHDRGERGLQPPELHLRREDGELIATVHEIRQEWDEEQFRFGAVEIVEHPLAAQEDLGAVLEEIGLALRILLVFTDEAVTYAEIMRVVRPVLDAYPTIFVLPPQTD